MAITVVVLEVLAVWGACVGVWLLTLSSVPLPELATAAAAGLACALTAVAARRVIGKSWRADPRWVSWLLPVPLAVVHDLVGVLGRLAVGAVTGGPVGQLRRWPLPRDGDEARASARRALTTLTVSVTPGTYVLDTDPDTGDVLVHEVVRSRPSVDDRIQR